MYAFVTFAHEKNANYLKDLGSIEVKRNLSNFEKRNENIPKSVVTLYLKSYSKKENKRQEKKSSKKKKLH